MFSSRTKRNKLVENDDTFFRNTGNSYELKAGHYQTILYIFRIEVLRLHIFF